MMTTNEDPIAKAIEALSSEGISPKVAEDVRRVARRTLEAEGSWLIRFDRLFMDRLMPAALFAMTAGYAVGFVDFLHRTYPGAETAQSASAAVLSIAASAQKRV